MTNALPILAWIAIVLNAGQFAWQTETIRKKHSGNAVSVAWFASSIGLEVVNTVFGWAHSDLLFIYNAIVCAAGQLAVLIALGAYKPFGRHEWTVISAVSAEIVAAAVLPFKAIIQMAAQAVNLYGGIDQPRRLKEAHGTGALALLALVMSGLSAVIWVVYCLVRFGWLGPTVGYIAYSGYIIFMITKWLAKASSARSR